MGGDGSYIKEEIIVEKPADETTTNDNTINNDSNLLVSLDANSHYYFEVNAGAVWGAGFIQIDMNGPAGYTRLYYSMEIKLSGIVPVTQPTTIYAAAISTAAGSGGNISIRGTVLNVNAGTLNFRWAQNVSNAAATTVRAGSTLLLRRISPT